MAKKLLAACVCVALSGLSVWAAQGDLSSVVERSMAAMGTAGVKTLVIYGHGTSSIVGQPFNPHSDWWRKLSTRDYVRSIDFDKKAWRLQDVLGEGENPPGGGAGRITPTPDLPQNLVVTLESKTEGGGGRGQGIDARAPAFSNQIEYAMLPLGFLKMALEKHARVSTESIKGVRYTVLTFPVEHVAATGGFKTTVRGWIDDKGLVQRVSTLIDNNVLGDIVWDVSYSDWKDFGGVKFPTHIVQHQGQPKFLDLTVSDVKVNVPVDLTPPAAGRGGRGGEGAGEREETPKAEDLGDGFWLVPGGYAGVFAVFNDYVVAIEGPQSDERAQQILREIKRVAPGKPVRYVFNTHAHFDHTGGLRAFVAEGATIVTNEGNKGYYETIFANSHSLVPDRLSMMHPQPKTKVQYVGDKYVMSDGAHTVELYRVEGSTHNAFMMMAYLPKQKILIEADEFNVPARAVTAPPARINSYEVNLLALIDRLHLDVERIIPIHLPADGRKVALSELKYSAGKP